MDERLVGRMAASHWYEALEEALGGEWKHWHLREEFGAVLRGIASACHGDGDVGWDVEDMLAFLRLEDKSALEIAKAMRGAKPASMKLHALNAVRARTYAQTMVKIMLLPLYGRGAGQSLEFCAVATDPLQCLRRKRFVHCKKEHEGDCYYTGHALRFHDWAVEQEHEYRDLPKINIPKKTRAGLEAEREAYAKVYIGFAGTLIRRILSLVSSGRWNDARSPAQRRAMFNRTKDAVLADDSKYIRRPASVEMMKEDRWGALTAVYLCLKEIMLRNDYWVDKETDIRWTLLFAGMQWALMAYPEEFKERCLPSAANVLEAEPNWSVPKPAEDGAGGAEHAAE